MWWILVDFIDNSQQTTIRFNPGPHMLNDKEFWHKIHKHITRNDDSISTNLIQKLTPLDCTSKKSMKFNKNSTQSYEKFYLFRSLIQNFENLNLVFIFGCQISVFHFGRTLGRNLMKIWIEYVTANAWFKHFPFSFDSKTHFTSNKYRTMLVFDFFVL